MKDSALVINGLSKRYQDFALEDISFSVPRGTIVGLIGENGAGKSTIINTILGIVKKDSGTVSILGREKQEIDSEVRNQIGVVLDGNNFPDVLSPKKLNNIFKNIYSTWDEYEYFSLIKKLCLPENKKIKEFSRGMKMKLSIAVALSHKSKLLILDEATSGLDPIVRDDILDMFLSFVQDEDNSILVSSHITKDLEKVADYIVFVHNGKLVFNKPKDELIYKYGIIKCGLAQFNAIDRQDIIAYRKQDYEWQVLVANKTIVQKKYPRVVIDPATIDDIMLLYVKGEKK